MSGLREDDSRNGSMLRERERESERKTYRNFQRNENQNPFYFILFFFFFSPKRNETKNPLFYPYTIDIYHIVVVGVGVGGWGGIKKATMEKMELETHEERKIE